MYSLIRIVNPVTTASLISGVLLIAGTAQSSSTQFSNSQKKSSPPPVRYSCLPKEVQGSDPITYTVKGKISKTVDERLQELKARCSAGRLLDSKGREIRFFRQSCWGNPPADYEEIRAREDRELAGLKRRYDVIVFGCNPMRQ